MQSMRKVFQQQNLSENVINLLMKSWTPSTCYQYSTHIIRWLEFSSSGKIDPFNASVNDGAEFLAKLFNESKCEYSVMNTVRSALSSIFQQQMVYHLVSRLLFKDFQKECLRKDLHFIDI